VHKHSNLPPALLHQLVLRCVFESPLLHQLEKQRRILAPGVGEDGLAVRCEQRRDEIREGRGVSPLVEYVGGEDEIESSETFRIRRVPVEECGLRFTPQVRPGVVGGKIEGGLVVVGRETFGAASEGDDGREPDTTAELDGTLAGQVFVRQILRQGDSARPELCPVRQPFVTLEVPLVQEGVRRGGVEDGVGPFSDLDEGFEQRGAAVEVCPEFVQRITYRPTEAASRAARPSRSAAASWAML
jgi:hypothetical protein